MPPIFLSASQCRAACFFTAVALLGLTADLFTKHWAFQTLGMPGSYKKETEPHLNGVCWIWQDVVGFQTSLNLGALFGMFEGQTTILVILSLVFLIGIILYVLLWAWQSSFFTAILGLLTAGICGNLYDRLGWHGLVYPDFLWWRGELHPHPMAGEPIYAVRDWILCMIGTFHWPNFNIADSLLVCSVILLLLHGFLWEENVTPSVDSKEHNNNDGL